MALHPASPGERAQPPQLLWLPLCLPSWARRRARLHERRRCSSRWAPGDSTCQAHRTQAGLRRQRRRALRRPTRAPASAAALPHLRLRHLTACKALRGGSLRRLHPCGQHSRRLFVPAALTRFLSAREAACTSSQLSPSGRFIRDWPRLRRQLCSRPRPSPASSCWSCRAATRSCWKRQRPLWMFPAWSARCTGSRRSLLKCPPEKLHSSSD
mmetsp:Transcript_63071/g.120069  ORF Transcript_63071/g.120069 Transcript_63071/m.120069 type:complete len:212 (-) Transcript_63071:2397-3032(-)